MRNAWLCSGSVNTAGYIAVRWDDDGSEAVFMWGTSRNRYISTDGAGAYDSLSYDAGGNCIW